MQCLQDSSLVAVTDTQGRCQGRERAIKSESLKKQKFNFFCNRCKERMLWREKSSQPKKKKYKKITKTQQTAPRHMIGGGIVAVRHVSKQTPCRHRYMQKPGETTAWIGNVTCNDNSNGNNNHHHHHNYRYHFPLPQQQR